MKPTHLLLAIGAAGLVACSHSSLDGLHDAGARSTTSSDDAGVAPVDAGSPDNDAGSPAKDAGSTSPGCDIPCGSSCCAPGQTCDAATAQCRTPPSCTPDCTGKSCGDNGCGGSCGRCDTSQCQVCSNGTCVATCGASMSCTAGACCLPVTPAPDVDPWTVRAPGSGFGGIVTSNTGQYTDVFLQSPAADGQPANFIRIGVRIDWGGSVVFFGLPSSNVIDAHDTGREDQIALYDQSRQWEGCAYNASCTGNAPCGTSNHFLGWDPVQGGDWCGHGSPTTWQQVGDSLVVTSQPIHWNPNWNASSCVDTCPGSGVPSNVTFTTSLRFLTPWVVEIASEVNVADGLTHNWAWQEFPCLYPSMGQLGPSMDNLFDAAGAPVTLPPPNAMGPVTATVNSPEPYVVWQNATNNYGVGLGADQGLKTFLAIRDDTTPFRYARAHAAFALAGNGTVRGVSYLALGDVSTVQGGLHAALASRPPFGYLDSPASGAVGTYPARGTVEVAGWVLDTVQLQNVSIEIDGAEVMKAPVNVPRQDVCSVYPNYDGCPTAVAPGAPGTVGFDVQVPTAGLSPCQHLLRVVAKDGDGNVSVLGERAIQAG